MHFLYKVLPVSVLIIFILAILTETISVDFIALALVIVTAYYAYQTYLSNKIVKKSFEISFRPYLSFDKVIHDGYKRIDPKNPNMCIVQLNIMLKNYGKVPLKYIMKDIIVSVDNKNKTIPVYDNKGSYVFPTQRQSYFCDVSPEFDINNLPIHGFIEYHLVYSSTLDESVVYNSRKKIKIILFPDRMSYRFLEEEED